jgi:hypothetical protein
MFAEIVFAGAAILLSCIAFAVGAYFIRVGYNIYHDAGDAFSLITDKTIAVLIALGGVAIDLIVVGAWLSVIGV